MSQYKPSVTRADFELASQVKQMYEELINSAGWKELTRIVQAQIQTRKDLIIRPDECVEDLFLKQKLRGEVGGLGLLLRTPVAILESANLDIEVFREQEKLDANSAAADPDTEPNPERYGSVPGGASAKPSTGADKARASSSPDAFRRSP